MDEVKRAPVRIQVWLDDNIRLDVRGWLDTFTANNEVPALDSVVPFRINRRHDFTVTAHIDGADGPWKFERGKPKVER